MEKVVYKMNTESKLLDRKILRSGHKIDQSLLWMVVLMVSFSLLMIYSASIAYAAQDGGDKWFYLSRQAVFLVAGGIAGSIAAKIPMMTMTTISSTRVKPWHFCFLSAFFLSIMELPFTPSPGC